jgi:hypothetical protein
MITDHDRSGWFGASDVQFIVGNWKTKTWAKWWLQKLGINRDHFENEYTKAGTNWEHRILDSLNLPNLEKDKQIIIEELLLRVNLDGNTPVCIKEVKTYQWEKGWKKTPQKYIDQVNVQMFASGIYNADIVAYGLQPEDYRNYLRELDPNRLRQIPVGYDILWIENTFLPRLRILADCLRRGVWPSEARF